HDVSPLKTCKAGLRKFTGRSASPRDRNEGRRSSILRSWGEMCLKTWAVAVLLVCATSVCAAGDYGKPATALTAQTNNNSSAASTFVAQSDGNTAPGNISKVDVHSMLYSGANTKIYAHLMLWFGPSNHISVGYTSDDATQVHKQITDMISRGIDGVIID